MASIGALVLTVVFYVIGLVILFFVIRNAVVAALASHYKTVRMYEATGVWSVGPHPAQRAPKDLGVPTGE